MSTIEKPRHSNDTPDRSLDASVSGTSASKTSRGLMALRSAKRRSEPAVLRGFLSANATLMLAEYIRRESLIDIALLNGGVFVSLGIGTTLAETRLTRASTREEFERFQLSTDRGYSIIAIERYGMPLIETIKAEFERGLEETLTVGAYVSNAGKSVLPPHADARMTVVLQVNGRKQIEFFTSDAENSVEVTLEPRDALFIPPNVQHRFESLSNQGSHLCITVPQVVDEPSIQFASIGEKQK